MLDLTDLQFPFLSHGGLGHLVAVSGASGGSDVCSVWHPSRCQAHSARPYLNFPNTLLPTEIPKLELVNIFSEGAVTSAIYGIPINTVSFVVEGFSTRLPGDLMMKLESSLPHFSCIHFSIESQTDACKGPASPSSGHRGEQSPVQGR